MPKNNRLCSLIASWLRVSTFKDHHKHVDVDGNRSKAQRFAFVAGGKNKQRWCGFGQRKEHSGLQMGSVFGRGAKETGAEDTPASRLEEERGLTQETACAVDEEPGPQRGLCQAKEPVAKNLPAADSGLGSEKNEDTVDGAETARAQTAAESATSRGFDADAPPSEEGCEDGELLPGTGTVQVKCVAFESTLDRDACAALSSKSGQEDVSDTTHDATTEHLGAVLPRSASAESLERTVNNDAAGNAPKPETEPRAGEGENEQGADPGCFSESRLDEGVSLASGALGQGCCADLPWSDINRPTPYLGPPVKKGLKYVKSAYAGMGCFEVCFEVEKTGEKVFVHLGGSNPYERRDAFKKFEESSLEEIVKCSRGWQGSESTETLSERSAS